MEPNNNLLEVLKAQITSSLTDSLAPAQANKFIDTVVDMSDFLKMISIDRNIANSLHLDSIGVAGRSIVKATEGSDMSSSAVAITAARRSLTPVECILPYDLSFSWLEANVEGQAAESKVNGAFAKAFSNDLVDLFFNGDATTGNFLSIFQGVVAAAQADGNTHPFTRGDSTDWKNVFHNLFLNLPSKYKGNRKALGCFVDYQLEQEYRHSLSDRVTALGDAYMTEAKSSMYMGIEIIPVSGLTYGTCFMTPKENFHLGFGRDIRVGKFINERKRVIEYTITARVDGDYAVSDAVSYCV